MIRAHGHMCVKEANNLGSSCLNVDLQAFRCMMLDC